MYAEQNSKLISNLYNARNRREVSDILEYMGESGDCVFVYPILDGYKKYKYSTIGYYFIWNLSRLNYPNLGKRLNELLESYEIQKEHIPMTLFFMAERRFFSEIANKMATMYLDHCTDPEFRSDFSLNGLGIVCVLEYLRRAGSLLNFEPRLRDLLFNENFSRAERSVVLSYLFEINQEKSISFLVDNYFDKIKGTDFEENIAREILFCQANHARKLEKLIIENGSAAADILKRYKDRRQDDDDDDEEVVYENTDAVIKIGILRDQINNKTLCSPQFGFKIFPDSDLLIYQSQSMDDKQIFWGFCKDLRRIIHTTDDRVKNHGTSQEESNDILSNVFGEDRDSNLAHLFLYLNAKKLAVDYNFFGFKELDQGLEDVSAQTEDKAFFEKLKHLGIDQLYRDKQWHRIHSFFLNFYVQVLENMNKSFNQLVNEKLDQMD